MHLEYGQWLTRGLANDLITSTDIISIPGTTRPLKNSFKIYYLSERCLPRNGLIARRFNLVWHGDILVVKQGRRYEDSVIQVGPGDAALIEQIICL